MYGIKYHGGGGFPGEVGSTLREAKKYLKKALVDHVRVELYAWDEKARCWNHVETFRNESEVSSFRRRG